MSGQILIPVGQKGTPETIEEEVATGHIGVESGMVEHSGAQAQPLHIGGSGRQLSGRIPSVRTLLKGIKEGVLNPKESSPGYQRKVEGQDELLQDQGIQKVNFRKVISETGVARGIRVQVLPGQRRLMEELRVNATASTSRPLETIQSRDINQLPLDETHHPVKTPDLTRV
jgi:hypothetical protein